MADPPTSSPLAGPLTCRRTRDPEEVEQLLRRDYFDEPIRSFPPSVLRTIAREWLPRTDAIYLVVAELGGQYAGFVFAHALGGRIWTQFARRYAWRHPIAFAAQVVRARGRRTRRTSLRAADRSPGLRLHERPMSISYSWSSGSAGRGWPKPCSRP